MTDALSDDREWVWVLGASEHCPDCPRLAAASPYLADELPPPPGSGATACKMNCRCQLKSGRRRGFKTTRVK